MSYNQEEIELMAHLMRRAGFGAPRAELEERVDKGYEATVDELVDPDKYGFPQNDEDLLFRHFPVGILPGGVTDPGQGNYIWQILNTKRPLQEKMTLFWHHVFATGNSKIDNCDQMLDQINMFRTLALGNYRELLVKLAKNPAMIFWLDNNENHKDRPNENWGRELLELFSMGQGNYSEKDVFECSRAFTGWTIAAKLPRFPYGRFPWSFEYRADDHDDAEKEFLGQRGNFDGEDIIDIVVRQPATARFIARHLYNFFVADDVQVPAWLDVPPKDPVAINIIGDAFITSGYDMKETMRALLNSDFFKESLYKKVKSPAEVVAGTLNLVGDFKGRPRPGLTAMGVEPRNMGQALLDPPSVEGWHTGPEWIDSGSLVRRINFVADRVADISRPGVQDIVSRIEAKGTISPETLVDSCLDLLGPVDMGEGTKGELVSYASRDGDIQWNDGESRQASARRVGDMLALIASTREYQFG